MSDQASQGGLLLPGFPRFVYCGVVQLMLPAAVGYVLLQFCSSTVTCLMALSLSICGARCERFVLSRDRLGVENDIPLVCVVLGIQ